VLRSLSKRFEGETRPKQVLAAMAASRGRRVAEADANGEQEEAGKQWHEG
jgi:hypothetical protein